MSDQTSLEKIPALLQQKEDAILADWKQTLSKLAGRQIAMVDPNRLAEHCRRFLQLLRESIAESGSEIRDDSEAGENLKRFLAEMSHQWTLQGFTPSETAGFIFSIKQALFTHLQGGESASMAGDVWRVNLLIDQLGLYTMEVHMQTREEVIQRQQDDLLEISTPVVSLWQGILALPIIGTLDSERTQVMMESLLKRIVETESDVAIIDITGVSAVDTLVAQHLIKTVTAARLMGAECIISGIRPQIAQTIVHLGVDLGDSIVTKSSLSSAFAHALRQRQLKVISA